MELDLSSQNSIRQFVSHIHTRKVSIDVLINNAGVLGVPLQRSVDGVGDLHFAVNHLGHFLLTLLLFPFLSRNARIVCVSSLAYLLGDFQPGDLAYETRAYSSMEAYGSSKLCNILFVKAMHQRLSNSSITIHAVHPGEVFTEIPRYFGPVIYFMYKWIVQPFLLSPCSGAVPSVFLATSPNFDRYGGQFWFHLTKRHEVLNHDDAVQPLWTQSMSLANIALEEYSEFCKAANC